MGGKDWKMTLDEFDEIGIYLFGKYLDNVYVVSFKNCLHTFRVYGVMVTQLKEMLSVLRYEILGKGKGRTGRDDFYLVCAMMDFEEMLENEE